MTLVALGKLLILNCLIFNPSEASPISVPYFRYFRVPYLYFLLLLSSESFFEAPLQPYAKANNATKRKR